MGVLAREVDRCWLWRRRSNRQIGFDLRDPYNLREDEDFEVKEYVRADLHLGAVNLLREARGYVADHAAAHPADRSAARLWERIDAAINSAGGR